MHRLDVVCCVVCPESTFGLNCSLKCHCEPDTACNKVNGLCLSGACAYGWTGPGCQTRTFPIAYQLLLLSCTNIIIERLQLNVNWLKDQSINHSISLANCATTKMNVNKTM